jgi:hypothetical protein
MVNKYKTFIEEDKCSNSSCEIEILFKTAWKYAINCG